MDSHPAVRRALTISTAGPSHANTPASALMAPTARCHFARKPPAGGIPTSDRDDRAKHTITAGIRFPIPLNSFTLVQPVLHITAPAQRNRAFFARAWNTIWSREP